MEEYVPLYERGAKHNLVSNAWRVFISITTHNVELFKERRELLPGKVGPQLEHTRGLSSLQARFEAPGVAAATASARRGASAISGDEQRRR